MIGQRLVTVWNLHDVSKVILPDHADLNILLIDDAPRLVVVQSNELTRSTVMEVDAVGLSNLRALCRGTEAESTKISGW